jgi:hypothetical protein
MTCLTCAHHRPDRYVSSGLCHHPRAYKPFGEPPACSVVWYRTGGRCHEEKR